MGSALDRNLMAKVDETLTASGLLANGYFSLLRSGAMTLEDFRRSQTQFYFAVDFFSRPMAALLMRVPLPDQRLGILENVVEEHGDFQSTAFHEATFRQFLESIGAEGSRPQGNVMGPAVHAFNSTLLSACLSSDLRTGIACLGVIEYAFADISSLIGEAVIQHGWVQSDDLVHYKLHAEIDKQHAADFFRLLEPTWQRGEYHEETEQGLRLGAYCFDRLYRDLTGR